MNERAKRIKEVIDKSGFSYAELQKITGVSKSSLQRYATGETKKIPIDVIEKIASATNSDSRYLMCWEEHEETNIDELIKKYDNIKPVKLKRFPLLGEIACGEPIFASED